MKTNSPALLIPAPSPATNGVATNALAGDIRDIKAPVPLPAGWLWFCGVLGALAVAALSYLAWRYWKKHRVKHKALEIVIPPHERARRKLQEALDLLYEPRPFCILVSDAVRLYLEEAFSLNAPERTTEEFLDELQSSALLSFSQKQSLADFLMRCDLVKFARDEPTVEHLKELYESALRLVDETSCFKPRPQTDSTSAESSPVARPVRPPPLPPENAAVSAGVEQQPATGNQHPTTR